MGSLRYGNETVDVEDWALRHLQVVIQRKLQRLQAFPFYWDARGEDTSNGSIWIAPGVFLAFRYDTAQRQALNREWLGRMVTGSDTTGLRVLPEHPGGARSSTLGSDPVQQGARAQPSFAP